MLVKENSQIISAVIEKLLEFLQTDEDIKSDLNDYYNMIQADERSKKHSSTLFPYLFERRIGQDRRSVFDIFESKIKKLSKEEKEVVNGLKNSINSVFEIKKVLNDGFELFNLINEFTVKALVLDKMSGFRGIASGQYLIGRLVPLNNKFYILEINEIISIHQKEKVLQLAVSRQMNNIDNLFEDNPEKIKEIENIIKDTSKKFKLFFKSDSIITTSDCAESLLESFNDYIEDGIKASSSTVKKSVKEPEKYEYFEVKEFTSAKGDFMSAMASGLSSGNRIFDVGILCDNSSGLYVLPFLGTFQKIMEADDYKSIDGYKDCLENFLKSNKIPANSLKTIYEKYPDKFLNIINQEFEKDFKTFEELISFYKPDYAKRQFSSTTKLYASKAFQEFVNFNNSKKVKNTDLKAGRNEPCPCGSGKKYKKCCLID